MAIEVFNRFEHKYMLDRETFKRVISVIDTHMELDSHNKNHMPYTIANIYYDTDDDYLIRTSLSKPKYKEKLRLRAYGVPDENQKVFLEIKKKFNGMVNKRRTTLLLNEAYDFVKTGIAPEKKLYMNEQVIKEITYFLQVYDLKPKLYLAYDRIAYFEKGKAYTLPISPIIMENSTMIPIRFISEQLGMKVSWNGETNLITVSSK